MFNCIIMFGGVLLLTICLMMVLDREKMEQDSVKEFESLSQIVSVSSESIAEVETVTPLQQLNTQNSDLAGWIKIEGTQIDYPVMQTPDEPEYYLHRDFDKNDSIYGIPFLDSRSKLQQGLYQNAIIYGHHMKNGSMFANLINYVDEDYAQQYGLITFDTIDQSGTYQVIAAFRISAMQAEIDIYEIMSTETKEQYDYFIQYIQENTIYKLPIELDYGAPLLTMVTCEYTQNDGRIFVIAQSVQQ